MEVKTFFKQKKERKKGNEVKELHSAIYERDNGKCILCGNWVQQGEKFHHQRFGANKIDRIECGVILCYDCHQAVHFGKNSKALQRRIEQYLAGIYPEFWQERYGVIA